MTSSSKRNKKITHVIRTDDDRLRVMSGIAQKDLPFTLIEIDGIQKLKSSPQNNTNHLWLTQAAEQNKQHSYEEYRGICKLHCGVPILRRDSEEYKEKYDKIIKPLPYWNKVEAMMRPLDFPVTRAMTKDQMKEYLENTYRLLTIEYKVVLVMPKDKIYE